MLNSLIYINVLEVVSKCVTVLLTVGVFSLIPTVMTTS